jgi:acetylornithine/succinyldiaminopimelate/putrescine aminotransferase
MPVFAPPRLMFVRGSGTQLWDDSGRRYLDFLSGIAVVSLGHGNPVVVEAIAAQLALLTHVSNFFANPAAAKAAGDIDLLRRVYAEAKRAGRSVNAATFAVRTSNSPDGFHAASTVA